MLWQIRQIPRSPLITTRKVLIKYWLRVADSWDVPPLVKKAYTSDKEYNLYAIKTTATKKSLTIPVTIETQSLEMELDTGAIEAEKGTQKLHRTRSEASPNSPLKLRRTHIRRSSPKSAASPYTVDTTTQTPPFLCPSTKSRPHPHFEAHASAALQYHMT